MTPFFMLEHFVGYLRIEKRFSNHSIRAYEQDLSQFALFLEQNEIRSLGEVTKKVIRKWIVFLIDEGITARSINRKLSALKSYFNFLVKQGQLEVNPSKSLTGPKTAKRLPEFVKESSLNERVLQDVCGNSVQGKRDLLIIELLYQTGIRLNELIELKLTDIKVDRIRVLGKRNKERYIPISSVLYRAIKEYEHFRVQQDSKEQTLFITDKGNKLYAKFVYRKINTYLGSVTNLEKRSPHVLRHTFATHMLNRGAGLEVLKDLMGHASLAATQVYTHNTFAQLNHIYSLAHPRGEKK